MLETTSDSTLSRCRCLVLDVSWRPLAIVDWRRAVCLELLQKGEVLEYHDVCVRSVSRQHPIPAVLRARYLMKNLPPRSVPLTKSNLYRRDGGACVYCGATTNLTVDHVVPVSKGGRRRSWDNVVTACVRCNNKKGDKTVKEMGWKLQRAPRVPSAYDATFLLELRPNDKRPSQWLDYLPQADEFRM